MIIRERFCLKVAPKYKRLLRFSFTALYASGFGYWLFHQFFRKAGEFGEEPSFYERIFGPSHVIAALFFIFVLGVLWTTHIGPSIRTGRHRISGWFFLALIDLPGSERDSHFVRQRRSDQNRRAVSSVVWPASFADACVSLESSE